jgi:uncharacterized RDD family membrane protein YckC
MSANANALPDPDHQAEFYQGVALKRGLAWCVDTLLTGILTVLIVPFTAFTALFYLPFLYLLVNQIYRWATIAGGSATLGMRLASIEFRRADGQRLDGVTAFLHTLGYGLSMGFVLPQLLSIAMMLFGARGQGLTDFVLGTVAINRAARF